MNSPPDLPTGLQYQRRTPTFTEETLPAALTKDHTTKAGVWGVIRVESGSLRFTEASSGRELDVVPGLPVIITPEVPHHVTPLGPVSFWVEFWS